MTKLGQLVTSAIKYQLMINYFIVQTTYLTEIQSSNVFRFSDGAQIPLTEVGLFFIFGLVFLFSQCGKAGNKNKMNVRRCRFNCFHQVTKLFQIGTTAGCKNYRESTIISQLLVISKEMNVSRECCIVVCKHGAHLLTQATYLYLLCKLWQSFD